MSAEINVEPIQKSAPSQSSLSSNSLQMAATSSVSKGAEEDEQTLQSDDGFLAFRTTQEDKQNLCINSQSFFSNNSLNNSEQGLSSAESLQIIPKNDKLYSQSKPEYHQPRNNYTNNQVSINLQCRWESSSSPSRESPSPQISVKDKETERRICEWLDEQGIVMISPSKKSKDYFEKKKHHIHLFKADVDSQKVSAQVVTQATEHTVVPLIEIIPEKITEIHGNSKSVVVDKFVFHSPLMQRRLNMMSKASSVDDSSMKNLANNLCSCVVNDEDKWRAQSWEETKIQQS